MRNLFKICFRAVLMATFAVWFGGFFFYVAFVVPIGTEVLGSARAQGFITRLVTLRINAMCVATLSLMLVELVTSGRWSSKTSRGCEIVSVLLIAITASILIWLHPQLDAMLDIQRQQVHRRTAFYSLHRVYLWVSTAQWACGWLWLVTVLRNWQLEKQRPVDSDRQDLD